MTKRRKIAENGDNRQRIEKAEIYKNIKTKAKDDIRKYNQEIIRETIIVSKSLKKVRRTQKLGQDRPNSWTSRVEKYMIKTRSYNE